MQKHRYEDYKYVMQDVYQLYLGAKYSFEEIVENEEIPFKFRLLVERYIYQDVDPETTLESQIYYLPDKGVIFSIYRQIKLKVKVNILEEKRTLSGQVRRQYTTKLFPITEFAAMTPQEKEAKGVVIQEICCSKLALMTF